ncbi:hypothetical protein JCM9803A_02040 [Rhodococcus erythropolis]
MDVLVAEVVVDPRNIEAGLPDLLRLEPAYLQLDDDESRLDPVEEQQVDIEEIEDVQVTRQLLSDIGILGWKTVLKFDGAAPILRCKSWLI